MSTFVSVGNANQPFSRLLEAVASLDSCLPKPVIVQHGHSPFRHAGFECIPFMDMDHFSDLMHNANLLILHAGAGSVIHAIGAGKKPVVMPRRAEFGEHVDDHQVEFARALANAGKVYLAETPDDLGAAVDKALSEEVTSGADHMEPPMVSQIRDLLAELASRG